MSAIGWRKVGWGQGARLKVTSHRFPYSLRTTEIGYTDKYMPELKGILAIWKEFEPAFYNDIVTRSQDYVTNRIASIAAKFPLGGPTGNDAVTKLLYESEELKKSISQIAFPLGK
jgi:chitinase